MDQDQNTSPAEGFPAAPSTEKSNLSMLAGVGAFIVILAGLGWYVMQGMTQSGDSLPPAQVTQTETPAATTSPAEDTAAAALSTQGSSDEVNAINADLNATDLNSLNDIDKI